MSDAAIDALDDLDEKLGRLLSHVDYETHKEGLDAYRTKVLDLEDRLQRLRNCVSETRGGLIDLDRLQNDGIRRTFIAILNGENF